MRSMILRISALCFFVALGGLTAAGNAVSCTVSKEDLEKIPTARDPWSVWQTSPGVLTDRIQAGGSESAQQAGWSDEPLVPLGPSPSYYDFDSDELEVLRATLLEAEAKALCETVQREGWKGLTLERALRAAPSQDEALVEANAAGLLQGFVALMLRNESCIEPPAEAFSQAQEYSRRFGWPASAPSDTLLAP